MQPNLWTNKIWSINAQMLIQKIKDLWYGFGEWVGVQKLEPINSCVDSAGCLACGKFKFYFVEYFVFNFCFPNCCFQYLIASHQLWFNKELNDINDINSILYHNYYQSWIFSKTKNSSYSKCYFCKKNDKTSTKFVNVIASESI